MIGLNKLILSLWFLGIFASACGQSIRFVQNKNQWPSNILYCADIPGGKVSLERKQINYLFYNSSEVDRYMHLGQGDYLSCHALRLTFPGISDAVSLQEETRKPEYLNFFLGNDKDSWATGVPVFEKIIYKSLFDGIDMELIGQAEALKYNFVVSAGADPNNINLSFEGAKRIYLRNGELHIQTSLNEIVELRPVAFQWVGDMKRMVPCQFKLKGNRVSFGFSEGYDPDFPLIIDPVVIFASYSGSYADNFGYSATYDDSGYAYSSGTVFSIGFPVTPGAFQVSFRGGIVTNMYGSGPGRDVGILKYRPDGSKLVYATYLGGSCNEDPHSMVVNRNFELCVFGNTCSSNFPIGQKFYDSSFNGDYDIFVARFSSNGKVLLSSTFIGGSGQDALNGYFITGDLINQSKLGYNYGDIFRGEINVDSLDNIYVITTTKSVNFPVTTNAFQPAFGGGKQDACVVKLNPDLSNLIAGTYLGGIDDDAGYGIAFDSNLNIFVCGGTRSIDFPVTPGKYKTNYQGGDADGFLCKLNNNMTQIISSSYVGTNAYDQAYFVQTDRFGDVYITGQTKSPSFPVKNVKFSQPAGKQFICKFNNGLDSLIYSTVFGSGRGEIDLSPSAFLVDVCERVYFSGWGGETNHWGTNRGYTFDLYVTSDAYQPNTDGSDFYVAVFARNIEQVLYATYFGGNLSDDHVDGGTSRFDKNGVIYQSVCASCGGYKNDFPIYPPNVWSDSNMSNNCNNAIFKIDLDIPDLKADFEVDTIFCLADSTRIKNRSQGAANFLWYFGDGDTSTAKEPLHHYKSTGTYSVTLIAINIFSCDQRDTITKKVVVYNQAESDFKYDTFDCVNYFDFTGESKYGETFSWDFGDGKIASGKHANHLYNDTGSYLVLLTVDKGTVCEHRTVKTVHVSDLPKTAFDFVIDTCYGKVSFNNLSTNFKTSLWLFGDGDSSRLTNPLHYYKKADTFSVTLIVEPYKVCADSSSKPLIILTPKADIMLDLDTCSFKGVFINPAKYNYGITNWNISDGIDTTGVDTLVHSFSKEGTYTCRLIANIGTICVDTVYRQIILPALPLADFTYIRQACSPEVLLLNHSENFFSVYWDFGNGKNSTVRDSVWIVYDSGGIYIIRLEIISKYNCTDTQSVKIPIDRMAKADFNLKWDTCTNTVYFQNNSTRNGSYYWYYGDGSFSKERKPGHSHAYDTTGLYFDTVRTYTIKLVVYDSNCVDSMIKTVSIHVPPPIIYDIIYDSCKPLVSFKAKVPGAKNYFWNFGDGKTANSENVVHEFSSTGDYKVKFFINLNDICTDSVEQTIHVTDYMDEEIIIPNVFTPNKDGINDVFRIKGLNFNCDVYELIIYNRWGQEVFHSSGNQLDWDGKTEGLLVSPDVYYYVFKSSKVDRAGTITVVSH